MKTLAAFLFLTLLSTHSLASALPDGTYTGEALWKSTAGKGSYVAETVVSERTIKASYTLPDKTVRSWNFEMNPIGNGFFQVLSGGSKIGEGYCLEQAQVCHYDVKLGNFSLEETITVQDGKLYRFGSKTDETGRIMWQESLTKQ